MLGFLRWTWVDVAFEKHTCDDQSDDAKSVGDVEIKIHINKQSLTS